MKNTILNYETEEVTLGETAWDVQDYFSKEIDIYAIMDQLGDYLDTYEVENNDKLERIAYELYGNTDYWDILLLINDKNPLFEMVYDYDLLVDYAEDRANYYKNVLYSHAPLTQTRASILQSKILETVVAANEGYRTILIIKPEKMNNFISLLKTLEYV